MPVALLLRDSVRLRCSRICVLRYQKGFRTENREKLMAPLPFSPLLNRARQYVACSRGDTRRYHPFPDNRR